MFGTFVGAYLLAKQAYAADRMMNGSQVKYSSQLLQAKVIAARFYIEQLLPQGTALLASITGGSELLFAIDEVQLSV